MGEGYPNTFPRGLRWLSALRSSGIGVSQHGRAEKLAKLAAASDLKNTEIANGNAKHVVLFAEDVNRGHRIDIARVPDDIQPGKWQSLCAREGTYRALKTDTLLPSKPEGGHVSGSSLSGDINDPDEQYMHESLFRWSGWSLVAPRPGKTIRSETNDDNNLQAEVPADVTDSSPPRNVSFANDSRPDWDEDNRVLTLFLIKGQILRLRYSSIVHPDFLRHFGIPRWAKSKDAAEACMKAAAKGANWLMTPYRNLTMVHATQQPVCQPELIKMTPGRGAGEHNVRLNCRVVRLHGSSTGKFEVEARWKEWVDDINKPEPKRVEFSGQLGEVRLAENHGNQFSLQTAVDNQLADPEAVRGDVHELSDTRFRLIQYRIRATTRFREYLPPSMYDKPALISRLGPVAEGPPVALPPDDDAGAPVLRDAAGSILQNLVHSRAPPKDPRLLYVVPTFKWSRPEATGKHEATRHGNGLRVWLDRPWFSSGDGELLGVVLHGNNASFSAISDEMEKLVTQWGTDPLWESVKPRKTIRDADFPARVWAETVPLQERPNSSQVRIVGHRVHWDSDRGLWFCDIELDPGVSYMPFVRLALVRYQPNAIPGAKISKVVLAEFSQILPRRRIVARMDADKLKVTLHGPDPQSGPLDATRDSAYQNVSFVNGPFETGRNRIELVLQEQAPGIESDLGWEDLQVLKQHFAGEEGDAGTGPVITTPGTGPVVIDPAILDPVGTGIDITAAPVTTNPFILGRKVKRRAGGIADLLGAVNVGVLAQNPGTALGTILGGAGSGGPFVGTATPGIFDPFIKDPAFWEGTATIPAGSGKRRVVLREFERFYSDNVVNENVGSGSFPRRIIEERLVFAEIIDLDQL